MDREAILEFMRGVADESGRNRVTEEEALRPDLAGLRLYEAPLLGVAAADDPLFTTLRRPGIIGPHFRLPGEWLPGAASVLSFFYPVTDEVAASNKTGARDPSPEWMHARHDGQAFINHASAALAEALQSRGHEAVVPFTHPDFISRYLAPAHGITAIFTSNWSERHVAHVAGLGTFGLSAGLITARGMAGRFGSVVTSLRLEPDPRPYRDPYEYCTRCGACIPRCVHHAITPAGKDHLRCSDFLDDTLERYRPRYGCGKCQVGVPCSRRNPAATR